jgi:hypothetical protein
MKNYLRAHRLSSLEHQAGEIPYGVSRGHSKKSGIILAEHRVMGVEIFQSSIFYGLGTGERYTKIEGDITQPKGINKVVFTETVDGARLHNIDGTLDELSTHELNIIASNLGQCVSAIARNQEIIEARAKLPVLSLLSK